MKQTLDHAVAEFAASHKRIITRDEAIQLGMSDRQIADFTARHRWTVPHGGVYSVGPLPASFEEKLFAACKAAGPDAFVSHRAAARHHRLDGAEKHTVQEITVRAGLPEPHGVKVHRTKRISDADVTMINGIPTSAINRTLLDYSAVVPAILVERAVEDAIRRGKATEGGLLRYLEAAPRGTPGKTRLRRVLMNRPLGRAAASGFEVMLLDLIREAGLEIPDRRVAIRNEDGTVVAEADLGYPRRKLLLEAHSRKWHSTARQTARDGARHTELERLGHRVEYFTWADVVHTPDASLFRIKQALRESPER